ncbi:LrgB family protein [Erysipelothrix urinaevulpis]|uniref:LrgB family protein n=1 Tax=Erysipelothrix urinaevulpis TaxID=2683717 RepID=UPI00135A0D8F|nr:LrgB family protein [Erysipelothrix urinaevulpis]
MLKPLLSSPFLWLSLTAGLYLLAAKLSKKRPKFVLFNPLVFSIISIIIILLVFDIPIEKYEKNTSVLSLFITPATVALAVKLEQNYDQLRKYWKAILIGIASGVLFHTGLIYGLALSLDFDHVMVATLLPKSITTAIAVDVSTSLGGIPSLTVAVVVFTGVIGGIIGPPLFKLFKINDEVAQGVALGSSAHAMGTAKAIELGDVQGAMAGLSIVITGITVVLLSPLTKPITDIIFK